SFWLLDLMYHEVPNGTMMILYGRDESGSVRRFEDSSLMPFFLSTADVDIPTAVKTYQTKNLRGNPVEMVKYSFPHPRDVRDYRHLIPPEKIFEADIYFTERYAYSKEQNVSGWNSSWDDGWKSDKKNDPPPELTLMSLDFEMYNPNMVQPSPENCPILMAGICFGSMFGDNLQGDPPIGEPEVIRIDECGNESAMLEHLGRRITEIDPDIIFTYGGSFFDMPYVWQRGQVLGGKDLEKGWLNWGRDGSAIRQSQYDSWNIPGRCHIDLNR